MTSDDATFHAQRVLPFSPVAIYGAFEDAEKHARWWGPAGFRNEFELHDFKPGGQWKFVMYGPDGKHFKNESVFEELTPASRVVIRHVSQPHYVLTIEIVAQGAHSLVTWTQVFERADVAAKIRHIVGPANEQNLDRLHAVLAES